MEPPPKKKIKQDSIHESITAMERPPKEKKKRNRVHESSTVMEPPPKKKKEQDSVHESTTGAIEHHERHRKIAKELGDKAGVGRAYGNIGNGYHSLGDLKKAIKQHERHPKIAEEKEDKAAEGQAYRNLGIAHHSLGDYKSSIELHERSLEIAEELGDKAGEGQASGSLGICYHSLGDYESAEEHHKRSLKIAKEVGDKAVQGQAYGNLGNVYLMLGYLKKAIKYHKYDRKIAIELEDKVGEGQACANLGNGYYELGDFKKALALHKLDLKIAKEVGDKAGEGGTHGNLGRTYYSLGDCRRAIEHHKRGLEIAREVGDKAVEALLSSNLAQILEVHKCPLNAISLYDSSLTLYNEVRAHLQFKDEWKISYSETYNLTHKRLWRLHLNQRCELKALLTAEKGRAQALRDLMEIKYTFREVKFSWFSSSLKSAAFNLRSIPTTTVFIASSEQGIVFWVIHSRNRVDLRRTELNGCVSEKQVRQIISTLNHNALEEIGARTAVSSENRRASSKRSLRELYDIIIAPIADLVHGDDLILVPEGPFCLVPFAALVNSNRQYLSQTLRIRVIPSLTTLQLVTDCPEDFHKKTGALLVGDPCLEEVLFQGYKYRQLPFAKKEVEMIGRMLNATPLLGKKATKDEVLKRLSTVALIHIAAHGDMEKGEILLAPNPTRETPKPKEKDFLLTMTDVSEAHLRARLVVLSCCHSARGEIKAEGVVGIARAFLGAGARSVVASLWRITDKATFQFMKHFYEELLNGKRVSEALKQAMGRMREYETFKKVKYWAPFIHMGDDVSLELK